MQKAFYDKLSGPYRADARKAERLNKANRLITRACYILYPVMLVILALRRDDHLLRAFLVPCISFAAVSLFRKLCNAKRPYEIWGTAPLIPKDTKGNSFPSRHVFSIFIIAMTAGYVAGPAAAIVLSLIGAFLAWIRVAAGVHFVRDVVAGAVIAMAIGFLFYDFM